MTSFEKFRGNKLSRIWLKTMKPRKFLPLKYVECQLEQPVASGWVVMKVHEVLEYDTATYMKNYVEGNQQVRQKCTNTVLSDLFKYANNSCFGGITLRYDNRLQHIPIYDQVEVADSFARDCRAENRFNPYRDDTYERIKELTEHYEETVAEVKNNRNLDDECLEAVEEEFRDNLAELEAGRPKRNKKSHDKQSHNLHPQTAAEQLADHLTDVRTRSCINIETVSNGAITHIVTKRKKKQVRLNQFV